MPECITPFSKEELDIIHSAFGKLNFLHYRKGAMTWNFLGFGFLDDHELQPIIETSNRDIAELQSTNQIYAIGRCTKHVAIENFVGLLLFKTQGRFHVVELLDDGMFVAPCEHGEYDYNTEDRPFLALDTLEEAIKAFQLAAE